MERITFYNKTLYNEIAAEIDLIRKAYLQMKVKGISMISENLEDLIGDKKATEKKKSIVDRSILKRVSDYVEAGYRDGIFGLSRYKRDTPTERRKANTVANEMQVLRAFFTELEDTEEISRSPFRKISRDRRVILTRKKYDDPVFLRKDEFTAIRDFKPSKTLTETQ